MSVSPINTPIFYDPQGTRRKRVWGVGLLVAAAVTALAAIMIASLLINPWLPRIDLRPINGLPQARDTRWRPPALTTNPRTQKARRAQSELQRAAMAAGVTRKPKPARPPTTSSSSTVAPATTPPPTKPLTIGFYVNWDDSSYQSLKRNLADLDWVSPEWLRLQNGDDPLARNIDQRALDYIRRTRPQMPIVPLLQNAKEGVWDMSLLMRTLADSASRQRLVDRLARFVELNAFQGICVDFEEVPTAGQDNLLRFMQRLHETFRSRGWIVAQAVPFDDSDWNYRAYAAATDYLLLMAYDEHWSAGRLGSIAGQSWFEETLARRMRELTPAKTIVGIGAYGYDWSPDGEAKDLTFQEAVLAARDSQARITFDPQSRNPYFQYVENATDNEEPTHTVWFLDGVTAYNQVRLALAHQPAGFALWRLGSEDPSLWSVFGALRMYAPPDGLRTIRYGYDVDFEGAGEILQVAATPQAGARVIQVDPKTNLILSEEYSVTPSSYVIRRTGHHPGLIALTFDDGPDSKWTPRILDVLKQHRIPATFFIIGKNGQANPGLVQRIVAEGHDIGNHTFTHPNLGEIPGRITELELNATQRLIESLTGRSTRLFRPPYFGDAEPTTPDEVEPAVRAAKLGYITIGLRIDPEDWARPGSEIIAKRTIAAAAGTDPNQQGQVVLLHDGGGDRRQTLEALPTIIRDLQARGCRFVTISSLAGLARDQAMPPLPAESGFFMFANRISFGALSLAEWLVHWIFLVGIIFGLGRLVIVGSLAWAQWFRARRRAARHAGESYAPLVSVIVPAYNEERVIVRTVESVLASDYPCFEIIVVDDGSIDRTTEILTQRFHEETRVRVFRNENAGKAAALNFGWQRAQGEVLVALDADTIFATETIRVLARRFHDPRIGAIAGNAKVGNRINLITRWQALEYITSQNLERRAFASLNGITVVPGAVGAWRRGLVERAGGFAADTLAEDQDLTLRIRSMGYKVGYEEEAIAWTEAPDTLRTLARQRFRWAFGTLQCMRKHIALLFRPRYGALGMVSLPNVWIFQILFPFISPLMDFMLIWASISDGLGRLAHPREYTTTNLNSVLFYYALFLAVDWLAAALAFAMEKRERKSLLWWLFLQRFCYRQVMYYVMVKSVLAAVHGALVDWGKLARKATVSAQP
ncbi:MAG: glycosyltransferase [Acidobacteria bacterium]|nr:glycosyltransferase [Acidobacteriota bacterium]